jgi:hypothetical protein
MYKLRENLTDEQTIKNVNGMFAEHTTPTSEMIELAILLSLALLPQRRLINDNSATG